MAKDGDDLQSKAGEFVRKVLTVGVGTVFLTEEALRGLVSEVKLPKELLTGLIDSAGRTKNEFFGKLSEEIMQKVVSKIDPSALVQELLERNEIELNVKVNVRPKARPSLRSSESIASDPSAGRSDEREPGNEA
jgi:hypothetical protein